MSNLTSRLASALVVVAVLAAIAQRIWPVSTNWRNSVIRPACTV